MKIKNINDMVDALADVKPGVWVEYWRGPVLGKCPFKGALWEMALRGEVHLAQKHYGEFDFGYWAARPKVVSPLSGRMQFFGRDDRGRATGGSRGKPKGDGENPQYAALRRAIETEGSVAGCSP